MEERAVADYFVVAGLPENPEPVNEDYCEGLNPNLKNIEPITDITVIFPSLGEEVPKYYDCVEKTPSGYPANMNSGSIRSPEVYLCYRRGNDKPPLVDIGVMYDGKERLLPDAEVVISTPEGRPANVNNTSARILLTYRRAAENMPCNELVVTDVCIIITNKGERPPHAFCLIPKNLNKGTIMGCDVFLCYKKSTYHPPLLSYKAEILLRYPPVDRKGFPFPSSVAMFCLPMCATIECWPVKAAQPRPVFSTFILTVADATEKIYGAAVTFYEKYPENELTTEQKAVLGFGIAGDKVQKSVHANKSICLLSHYPFFDSFRTFLLYVSKMALTGPHEVPIERYISHLLEEVPFPSLQRPHILMQLSPTQSVLMSHPHDSPRLKNGASFRFLLSNLGPENCLMVLLLMLMEQKLLIHSLRPDVLTAVSEAVSVLIFPFHWQCPYIPLCPLALCDVLQAPVPFLIGVDSRLFDLYEPPADVTCIDLDTNTITVSEDKRSLFNIKLLPKKPSRTLKHTLEVLQDRISQMGRMKGVQRGEAEPLDIDFQNKKRESALELDIQEAFLRFMISVLKGYRSFLHPIMKAPTIGATDASSLFDFQGFLRTRDKNYQKFYQLMLKTQMFFRFIEERSFVSDMDSGLAFFDECIDKAEQDDFEGIKLMDTSEGNQSERTVFVMPPERIGLPAGVTYSYNSNFKLNDALFGGNMKLKSGSLDRVLQRANGSAPGSPVARRTKQEIKSAKKNARKYADQPKFWAIYLLSTCYSLWFIHLPSYLSMASSKHMALCLAFEMLVRMYKNRLLPADEVCYRVVMQLCGLYSQPVVAVRVLFEMKRHGVTPNAITYGFYNKAVLEAQWPSNVSNSSQLLWNKLRNAIMGVAQFRAAGRRVHRLSLSTTDEVDRLSTGSGGSSGSQPEVKGLVPPSPSATCIASNLLSPQEGALDGKTGETVNADNISARVSSSSDVGYGSMYDQAEPEDNRGDQVQNQHLQSNGGTRFWGKMGQSFDSWVKSGVNSLGNLATLATESTYYSPTGLIMSSYRGEYSSTNKVDIDSDIEEEHFDENFEPKVKGKSHRKLEFSPEGEKGDGENDNGMRLFRSVSFGNDTQIMSKLKELREEMASSTTSEKPVKTRDSRGQSQESTDSLEARVNRYYEESEVTNAENNIFSNSREITPVDEEGARNIVDLPSNAPRSPSIPVRNRENLDQSRNPNLSPSPTNGTNLSSPARTPVTQNDPLGALGLILIEKPGNVNFTAVTSLKSIPGTLNSEDEMKMKLGNSPKRTCSEGRICLTPSHHNGGIDLSGTGATSSKQFHRSSTLPNYASTINGSTGSGGSTPTGSDKLSIGGSANGANVVSSLSAFGSSLKSFSRYSPGRLSLRKAGTHLLESTIGNKKAEAFMEGFNQFKSVAAVTAKKKLDEFKEAINNTNSPANKNGPFGRIPDENNEYDTTDLTDFENVEPVVDQWANVSESYLDQLLTTAEPDAVGGFLSTDILGPSQQDTPLSSSTQSLLSVDHISRTLTVSGFANRKDTQHPVAVEINMTTCSLCHNCSSLLFDEEIMAGWTAEDSNLNTKCPHCRKWEVPFLEVVVKDFRHMPIPASTLHHTMGSAPSLENMLQSQSQSRRFSLNPSLLSCANPAQTPGRKTSLNPAMEIVAGSTPRSHSHNESLATGDKRIGKDETDGQSSSPVTENRDLLNSSGLEAVSNCANAASPNMDPLGVLRQEETVHPVENGRIDPVSEGNEGTKVPLSSEGDAGVSTPSFTLTSSEQVTESTTSVNLNETLFKAEEMEGLRSEPIIVPYLSPIVLRKELENVLEHEGDSALVQSKFVDEHPIIYWNMVWFFHRANLTSHLKGLILNSSTTRPKQMSVANNGEIEYIGEGEFTIHPSWERADHRNVIIGCKWDNSKFHEQFGTPLYEQWLQMQKQQMAPNEKNSEDFPESQPQSANRNETERLIMDVFKSVTRGEVSLICPKLLHHYHRQSVHRHYPTYRDILFLALVAGGREAVDFYGFGFDRDYRNAYSRLRNSDEHESMDLGDLPPGDSALFCRKFFRDLQLM